METTFDLDQLFQKAELIPVIIQDASSLEVLMLGFTNREAVELTLKTRTAWFWSRSRQKLWNKGESCEEGGHRLRHRHPALPLRAGGAHLPHRGPKLLFQRNLGGRTMSDTVLRDLYQVVLGRKAERQEGSYTCYLFDQGLDKILKKVGEESAETIIAAKNGVQERTVEEISDLLYHLMVLMAAQDIPLEAVLAELDRRSRKIGNLKQMKTVDHET